MTERKRPVRKAVAHTNVAGRDSLDRFQDEVYRQMFLLESHRPGSEMELAIALLRAWNAAESAPLCAERRQWLKKICPLCLEMIEAARHTGDSEEKCIQ